MPTGIIQIGLGPIGLDIARRILEHPDLRLVGAVDPAPGKAWHPLSELYTDTIVPANARDIIVAPSLGKVLSGITDKPATAIHTTGSFLSDVTPQILEIAGNGLNVISTTEELSYPWRHHPREAQQIDECARNNNVSVLGTGVNPGYIMDLFPVFLSAISRSVESVYVKRVVDAELRRGPLRNKIGTGITVEEFNRRKASGRFGHIGLVESVAMIGSIFNWELTSICNELSPKVSETMYTGPHVAVPAGNILGIVQTAIGYDTHKNERIRLELEMYVGAQNTEDTVRLTGIPDLNLTVANGIPGDIATVSTTINYIPLIQTAPAGLITPEKLPLPRWFNRTDRLK